MKLRRPSRITREKTLLHNHCNARQRTGFNSRSVYVGFVVDKVALGKFLFEYFGFSLAVLFHGCSMHIHLLIHLIHQRSYTISVTDRVVE
jgi:hypothetical protein